MRRNIKNAKWIESADYSICLQDPTNPLAFNNLENEERMEASDVSEDSEGHFAPLRTVSLCFIMFRVVSPFFALFRNISH